MKKLSIALAFIALASLSSCENEGETCLEVKIVAELCGNAVVQVVSGNAGIPVTESWTDHNNVTYDNVFSTFLDPCDSYLPARGETVLMKITKERKETDCAVCLALPANSPKQFYYTEIVTDCGM